MSWHWLQDVGTWGGWRVAGSFSLFAAGVSILAERFFGWREKQSRRLELLRVLKRELSEVGVTPFELSLDSDTACVGPRSVRTPALLLDGQLLTQHRDRALIGQLLRLDQVATTYRDVATSMNLIVSAGNQDYITLRHRQTATTYARGVYKEFYEQCLLVSDLIRVENDPLVS